MIALGVYPEAAGSIPNAAEALRFDWPRAAATLDRIADSYEADARREDESAEQRDGL